MPAVHVSGHAHGPHGVDVRLFDTPLKDPAVKTVKP
jgi:hypothetical protein